jgi:hypothetical protein
VTRLKSNAKYKRVKKNPVKTGGVVVSEYEIIIPLLSKGMLLRKIIVKDSETGKSLTVNKQSSEVSGGSCISYC